jgi:hypothetical protein
MKKFTDANHLAKFLGNGLKHADVVSTHIDPDKQDHYEDLLSSHAVSSKYHVTKTADGFDVTHKLPTIETCFGKSSKTHLQESWESDMHDAAKIPEGSNKQNLHDYTLDSQEANTLLHGLHSGDESKVEPNKHRLHHIRKLDKDFGNASTTKDLTVYTGLRRSPFHHFDGGESSVVVHHPAFLSTSTSHEPTQEFSKILAERPTDEQMKHHGVDNPEFHSQHFLKIHAPKGSAGISLQDISEHPNENEILFHRGHDIKIHSKPTVFRSNAGLTQYVWNAELHNHNPSIVPRSLD